MLNNGVVLTAGAVDTILTDLEFNTVTSDMVVDGTFDHYYTPAFTTMPSNYTFGSDISAFGTETSYSNDTFGNSDSDTTADGLINNGTALSRTWANAIDFDNITGALVMVNVVLCAMDHSAGNVTPDELIERIAIHFVLQCKYSGDTTWTTLPKTSRYTSAAIAPYGGDTVSEIDVPLHYLLTAADFADSIVGLRVMARMEVSMPHPSNSTAVGAGTPAFSLRQAQFTIMPLR